jgi:hypothetical protein
VALHDGLLVRHRKAWSAALLLLRIGRGGERGSV